MKDEGFASVFLPAHQKLSGSLDAGGVQRMGAMCSR
jgi:hypothetical protein